jgi:hypothetical protein
MRPVLAGKLLAAIGAAGLIMAAGAASAADAPAPTPAYTPSNAVPPVCDRACLKGFIDSYLAALAARDPSKLQVTRDVRYTENGAELKLGDGMWSTVDRLGDYKLYFVDPDTAEAGFFGTVIESGRPVLIALRLHIQSAAKISQVEVMAAREGLRGAQMPAMTPKPIFYEDVPQAKRRSRAQMMAIVDSYFEGLEHATDKLTPFDPNCQRIENGMVTSGDPNGPAPMQRMTCGAQFATGFSPFITAVRERRFPIMDQEKGLGFAMFFFDHAGAIKDVKMTDGTNLHVPPPFDRPYAFQIAELFKIVDGRIIRVEAVLSTVPYGMKSGW